MIEKAQIFKGKIFFLDGSRSVHEAYTIRISDIPSYEMLQAKLEKLDRHPTTLNPTSGIYFGMLIDISDASPIGNETRPLVCESDWEQLQKEISDFNASEGTCRLYIRPFFHGLDDVESEINQDEGGDVDFNPISEDIWNIPSAI
jgi:hypothetical protein